MDEAETLCDRVAIVDHGRVIALGTPRELIASLGAGHVVEFAIDHGARVATGPLTTLPGVTDVCEEGGTVRLRVTEPHVVIPALLSELERQRLELAQFATHQATLEDVFVAHTGRHLRDE
jgi:ABC-2 type transport system ATP-binding protein